MLNSARAIPSADWFDTPESSTYADHARSRTLELPKTQQAGLQGILVPLVLALAAYQLFAAPPCHCNHCFWQPKSGSL
jgi:hypothetical protein